MCELLGGSADKSASEWFKMWSAVRMRRGLMLCVYVEVIVEIG